MKIEGNKKQVLQTWYVPSVNMAHISVLTLGSGGVSSLCIMVLYALYQVVQSDIAIHDTWGSFT